jgi:hypothetical protein
VVNLVPTIVEKVPHARLPRSCCSNQARPPCMRVDVVLTNPLTLCATLDDVPALIDRIVRYCNSPVALQRLVHVKMLAEASELSGYVHRILGDDAVV